jgi:hypothetical protein
MDTDKEHSGDQRNNRETPVEKSKILSVRVRVIDMGALQDPKNGENETLGDVIHRVLSGHAGSEHGDRSATYRYIDKLNTIITNQFEEIKTLRREVANRDTFIGDQSVTIEDLKGKLVLACLAGDKPFDCGIYGKHGTTINITIKPSDE